MIILNRFSQMEHGHGFFICIRIKKMMKFTFYLTLVQTGIRTSCDREFGLKQSFL